MKKYDIAIIGAGPAGATLARLICDKYQTIVIDKKTDTPESFKKCCGGLLSPDAQKLLAEFDFTLPKDILVDPQIFSVRTIDVGNNLTRRYQRFYMNLDRHKFDMWLKSLIGKECTLVDGNFISAERKDDSFEVTYNINGTTEKISAKYLVGADGANSFVRKEFFPNVKINSYIAIQQWFKEEHLNPFYSCIFDKEITDCCSWSLSKDDCFIFGGAYPQKNCRKRFEEQKIRLEKLGFKFGEPLKTEACMILRPQNPFCITCGKDNVFLIGEAAGFISPSSFEGISFAIKTAQLLSEVLLSSKENLNKKYSLKCLKLKIKIFAKLIKCLLMYSPFWRKMLLKSRLFTIKKL